MTNNWKEIYFDQQWVPSLSSFTLHLSLSTPKEVVIHPYLIDIPLFLPSSCISFIFTISFHISYFSFVFCLHYFSCSTTESFHLSHCIKKLNLPFLALSFILCSTNDRFAGHNNQENTRKIKNT